MFKQHILTMQTFIVKTSYSSKGKKNTSNKYINTNPIYLCINISLLNLYFLRCAAY